MENKNKIKINGELMRIDDELATQIREFAKKNDLKFIQASREIAKMNRIKFADKKIIKEIKF